MAKLKSDFSLTSLESKLSTKPLFALIIVSILINLFFIQALRAVIPGIYVAMFNVVFGIDMALNFPVILTLIFFFVPGLTNTICKKISKQTLMTISIYVISILRVLIAMQLPSKIATILNGIIISFYGFFISTFITLWVEEKDEIETKNKILIIALSILIAFLIDYLIRTLGFSQDITLLTPGINVELWQFTQYIWFFIQIPLSIICIYLTRTLIPRYTSEVEEKKGGSKKLSSSYAIIFIGIGMFLFLQFNLFLYPNAIGQYTGTSYNLNNIFGILAVMGAVCVVVFVDIDFLSDLKIVAGLNGLMIASFYLFLTLGEALGILASILISISLLIMYLNFYLLIDRMVKIEFNWEKVKTISNAITIGFAFYVLFDVFHIFTTDWAFTLDAMRGYGPLLILIMAIIFSASAIIASMLNSTMKGEEK